jgi:hypothetical protein
MQSSLRASDRTGARSDGLAAQRLPKVYAGIVDASTSGFAVIALFVRARGLAPPYRLLAIGI